MTIVLCALYLCIGCCLINLRVADIRRDVPNPEDPFSIVSTGFKWALTWPLWVGRRA